MSSQKRKVVLITGATGGIGKATAIAFAKTGKYNLALHYNSASEEKREEILASLRSVAPKSNSSSTEDEIQIEFHQADLGDFDHVRMLHRSVLQSLGPVDILFNNAGSTSGQTNVSDLSDVPIETFENTWRLNAGSSILLAQLCLPEMEARGWGRIVFNSSVAAFTGGVVGPHYASSKSALHGFIHWLAVRVAKKGVTVNGVAPALIGDTTMMGRADDPEARKVAARNIPAGRLGRPEEVANTVMWMVDTGFVTNKIIGVDGGHYAY